MELKDVILSTLAEMQEDEPIKKVTPTVSEPPKIEIIKTGGEIIAKYISTDNYQDIFFQTPIVPAAILQLKKLLFEYLQSHLFFWIKRQRH